MTNDEREIIITEDQLFNLLGAFSLNIVDVYNAVSDGVLPSEEAVNEIEKLAMETVQILSGRKEWSEEDQDG